VSLLQFHLQDIGDILYQGLIFPFILHTYLINLLFCIFYYTWQYNRIFSYDFYSCDFTSTNGDCIFACATDDPVRSINTSVTAYYGLAGSLDTSQSTETNAQVTVNNAFKFSQLTCNVTSNSITGNSTVNLRKNAGNAGPTL
jgi:hypothetical protein